LGAVDVVAGAERDPRPGRRPDLARVQNLAYPAHRCLEAEVLVHGQRHAGLGRRLHDRHRLRPIGGERLLHDHRHAARRRDLDQRPVRVHPGDDVDQPGPLGVEHRGGIRVPALHAELRRGCLRLARIDIAHRDESQAVPLAGEVAPSVEVVAGEEAAADERDVQGGGHCSRSPAA
jgi:hypothetical protein